MPIEHLFLHCNLAFHLWRSSPWGIFSVSGTGIRMWDWVKFLWNLKSMNVNTDEVFLYASIVVDKIWRVRNDKRFHYPYILPDPPTDWNPPPQDWIKIHCDAKVGGEHMCVAVVARDYLSRLMWVFTAKMDFSDALCGEAAAVCLVLEVAKEKVTNLSWWKAIQR
uniref:RNase H type-1 domain-containing protein n=1 Tax=Cannabis sativa TaxID=3483 RepID=A0A803QG36_CANSA